MKHFLPSVSSFDISFWSYSIASLMSFNSSASSDPAYLSIVGIFVAVEILFAKALAALAFPNGSKPSKLACAFSLID